MPCDLDQVQEVVQRFNDFLSGNDPQ
jgi:hypothetical protein